ncbi:MAG: HesA/MoeB/ThiF family protein, partial [Anaerolineales bacterium]
MHSAKPAIQEQLRNLASNNGDPVTVGAAEVEQLASAHALGRREVELAALDAGIAPRRYVRNLGTVGMDGQARLLRSCVAVVGLGGLGGYVVEGLARMGVGRLLVIDGDDFEETNLNRQLLSLRGNMEMGKVEAALERVGQVNDSVEIVGHTARLGAENLDTLLAGAQVVVDCLDRLHSRLVLQAGARRLGIPMVHGSIAGFLGQVIPILPGAPGLEL